MSKQWGIRYSPSEMLFLEVAQEEVRIYLNDFKERDDERYSFEDALAGELDKEVGNQFGQEVVEQLKQAVREQVANNQLSPAQRKKRDLELKQKDRERRRLEGK